jgi:opacity protein-like surface antigen
MRITRGHHRAAAGQGWPLRNQECVMRLPMLLVVLAAAPLATAAQAQSYVGVSGGWSLPEDSRNRGAFTSTVPATSAFGAIPAGTSLGWRTELDNGFNLAAQLGHRFDNGLRTELELAWTRSGVAGHRALEVGGTNIDAVNAAILTRGPVAAGGPSVGQVLATDGGRVSSVGVFGNIFYDLNRTGRFQPYVGAGAGFQRVHAEFAPSGVPVADGSKLGFAYQLMAGATYRLSDRVDAFAQYTWRDTDRVNLRLDLLPATLGVQSRQSIVGAGIRFNLDGAR